MSGLHRYFADSHLALNGSMVSDRTHAVCRAEATPQNGHIYKSHGSPKQLSSPVLGRNSLAKSCKVLQAQGSTCKRQFPKLSSPTASTGLPGVVVNYHDHSSLPGASATAHAGTHGVKGSSAWTTSLATSQSTLIKTSKCLS